MAHTAQVEHLKEGASGEKVKSSLARSFPVENLRRQNVGSSINYLQQSTEVAQWGTPSCSRPQPATDNGVRDGRSNLLVAPPPSWVVSTERLVHSINRCSPATAGIRSCNFATFSMRGYHLAYAATQGMSWFYLMDRCTWSYHRAGSYKEFISKKS